MADDFASLIAALGRKVRSLLGLAPSPTAVPSRPRLLGRPGYGEESSVNSAPPVAKAKEG
jgi:hypothetical protein